MTKAQALLGKRPGEQPPWGYMWGAGRSPPPRPRQACAGDAPSWHGQITLWSRGPAWAVALGWGLRELGRSSCGSHLCLFPAPTWLVWLCCIRPLRTEEEEGGEAPPESQAASGTIECAEMLPPSPLLDVFWGGPYQELLTPWPGWPAPPRGLGPTPCLSYRHRVIDVSGQKLF